MDQRVSLLVSVLRKIADFDTDDIRRSGLFKSGDGFLATGAVNRGIKSSYEDIYFLCSHISNWSRGLVDNSLITPFMEKIVSLCDLELQGENLTAKLFQLADLGDELCEHIHGTVAGLLDREYICGLDLILSLAKKDDIKEIAIFTLNHDTLLEQFLAANGICYIDGFGPLDGDVRWYDENNFDADHAKVKIFKLHGSINWYRFVQSGKRKFAVLKNIGRDIAFDSYGDELKYFINRPAFLTGMDKNLSYHLGIYKDLFFQFSKHLKGRSQMIMSGYSWGDFTINSYIDSWLESASTNKLVLLHRNANELCERSILFEESLRHRTASGQLILVPKWLSEVSPAEVTSYLLPGIK